MKAEDVLDIFETKCLISNTQPVMEINTLIWYTNDRKYCIIAEYDDDTFVTNILIMSLDLFI